MELGINIDRVQRSNRNLVLRLLLEQDSISRVNLSKKTGLKKATITNIINEFIEMGIVKEYGQIKGEHGRSTSALKLLVPKARIVVASITRLYFEIESFDLNGQIHCTRHQNIDTRVEIKITFELLKEQLRSMIDEIGTQDILGVCVAVPGPFIQSENITHVTGFEELGKINIKLELEKEYNFPIFIQHDAKLSALAEWKFWSKANKVSTGILIDIVSIGQGVGAGIIINDKIIEGKQGTAGEIGYMGINYNGPVSESGNRGIFENYSAVDSIKRHMMDRLHEFDQTALSESSSLEDIYREYEAGNELAKWAVEKTAWYMGYGIASLVALLNPNIIIIGSAYPNSQKFIEVVRATVEKLVYIEIYNSLKIDMTQISGNAILSGGFSYVVDKLFNSQQILDQIRTIVTTGNRE